MDISAKMNRFTSSRSRTNLISGSTKTFSHRRKGSYTRVGDTHQGCNKKARRSHSQIEKRRRDKINNFIDELASLLPTCKNKSRKLNKLSVLRMAVQRMKMLRGSAVNHYTEVNPKPVFFSDEELKHMIQRAADGFLFVVDCHQGKILFVSESVFKILNYSHNDLIGQSLFDYLHPKDIAIVKEQLSSAVANQREKDIDAKNINTSSLRPCSGVRRSFFCRMKCNQTDCKAFCTIHSTGYLKSRHPTAVDLYEINNLDNDGCNLSCLVAVGRLHPCAVSQPVRTHVKLKPIEFVSRHAIDGKFVFVDRRATAILAYLPQELLGTSFYEYFHEDDIDHLSECHKKVLQTREKINTNCYKFKIKDGSFITVRSRWFGFMNPWTEEVECIVSTNTVVTPPDDPPESSYHPSNASEHTMANALMPGEGRPGVQTETGMRTGAGRIGQMIAEELLEIQRMDMSSVISEGQTVLEEAVSSVVSVALERGRGDGWRIWPERRKRGNLA